MKTPLFIAALLACTIAYSQETSLPLKNNSIHYSDIVITPKNTGPEIVTARLSEWIVANAQQYNFIKQTDHAIGNLIRVKGKTDIDPDRRSLHNVDCEFIMDITIIDGRYRVELYDFNFVKGDQKFDASEVYKAYLKRDPFVKTAFESRDAALERHQFLLKTLQSKMNAMLTSMQKSVEE